MMLVPLAGCFGQEAEPKSSSTIDVAPPAQDEGQIRGIVTDDSLNPIPDVDVAILKLEPRIEGKTDAAGSFVLPRIPPGTYTVAVQRLGFESGARAVDVGAGQVVELNFQLEPIGANGIPYHLTIIGEGYFACGAYLILVTWGNLDACVWDDHKPRYEFEVPKTGIMGIMQEVAWNRN